MTTNKYLYTRIHQSSFTIGLVLNNHPHLMLSQNNNFNITLIWDAVFLHQI